MKMSEQNKSETFNDGNRNFYPGLTAFKKLWSTEVNEVHGGQDNKKDFKNQNDCTNCGRPVRFSNFCSVECQRETFGA
jgi:hypothetical protein